MEGAHGGHRQRVTDRRGYQLMSIFLLRENIHPSPISPGMQVFTLDFSEHQYTSFPCETRLSPDDACVFLVACSGIVLTWCRSARGALLSKPMKKVETDCTQDRRVARQVLFTIMVSRAESPSGKKHPKYIPISTPPASAFVHFCRASKTATCL